MNIEVTSVDPGDLSALYGWLVRDPDVRRHAQVRRQEAPARISEMGPTLELLNVVLSNAVGILGLVTSVAAFRQGRRGSGTPAPVITITHGSTRVVIDSDSPEVIQEAAAVLSRVQGSTDAPGDAPRS